MIEIKNTFIIHIINYEKLTDSYQKLIQTAKAQTQLAYAPYSHFQVGAAVLLNDGNIIGGNNQENSAFPSGLCAERVALFYANSQYPQTPVKAIAIAAFQEGKFTSKPISPCGACRQVMIETETRFGQNIELLLYGKKEIFLLKKASDLLPLSFSL
ncbi:MAG: cytidine deaminase [Paludibacteraceae bacterium]|nr:cytidine deaminase [Paludibacteraceae bacterium]MBN2787989.1 cytidine deaminase [Paludibacteraceae bacterium]